MKTFLSGLALLAAPIAAAGQPVPPAEPLASLDLEQRMLLRCSAAFALVADRQQRGEDWALQFPPMGEIGQDFFVAAIARVMDEVGLSEEAVEQMLREEVEILLDRDLLSAVMPVCLRFIEPSEL